MLYEHASDLLLQPLGVTWLIIRCMRAGHSDHFAFSVNNSLGEFSRCDILLCKQNIQLFESPITSLGEAEICPYQRYDGQAGGEEP